ncbi:MAG: hypothetical protein K2Q33_07460, partial [Gammaproteobacteria bacterium]|nr:hypothetical protein [Gammaproteobacteria bacterium]
MSANHEAIGANFPSPPPQKPLSEVYSLAYITKLAIACRIYHDIPDVESQKTEIKEMHQHLLFLFRDIFLCPEGVTASKTILSTYLHILLPVYLDWINTAMYKHKDLDAARDYIGHATELYTVLLENGSNKNEWLPADFANTCAQFLKDTQQLFSQLNEKIKNKSLEAGIFPPYVDTDKGTYALIHLTRYAIHRKNFDEAKSYLEDAKKISCSIRNELVKQGYQTILFELSTKLTEQIQYEPIYSLVSHSKKAISDKNLEAAKEYLNAAAKVLSQTSQKDIQEHYS